MMKTLESVKRRIENMEIGRARILCVEEARIDQIKSMLRLDHLNVEEYQSIMRSIENNKDRFHVPGDPLEGTNVLKHRIELTSNTPINVKQYRLPPCYREEVDRQVKEYLDNDIIRPITILKPCVCST